METNGKPLKTSETNGKPVKPMKTNEMSTVETR